jgi:hypothetical protein
MFFLAYTKQALPQKYRLRKQSGSVNWKLKCPGGEVEAEQNKTIGDWFEQMIVNGNHTLQTDRLLSEFPCGLSPCASEVEELL